MSLLTRSGTFTSTARSGMGSCGSSRPTNAGGSGCGLSSAATSRVNSRSSCRNSVSQPVAQAGWPSRSASRLRAPWSASRSLATRADSVSRIAPPCIAIFGAADMCAPFGGLKMSACEPLASRSAKSSRHLSGSLGVMGDQPALAGVALELRQRQRPRFGEPSPCTHPEVRPRRTSPDVTGAPASGGQPGQLGRRRRDGCPGPRLSHKASAETPPRVRGSACQSKHAPRPRDGRRTRHEVPVFGAQPHNGSSELAGTFL
jgi:hypothetical protein